MKHHDLFGARLCSGCHAFVDGGWARSHYTKAEMLNAFSDAMRETQQQLINEGLILIIGE